MDKTSIKQHQWKAKGGLAAWSPLASTQQENVKTKELSIRSFFLFCSFSSFCSYWGSIFCLVSINHKVTKVLNKRPQIYKGTSKTQVAFTELMVLRKSDRTQVSSRKFISHQTYQKRRKTDLINRKTTTKKKNNPVSFVLFFLRLRHWERPILLAWTLKTGSCIQCTFEIKGFNVTAIKREGKVIVFSVENVAWNVTPTICFYPWWSF